MYKFKIAFIAAVVFLPACNNTTSLGVNIDFAKTNLGYVNSGAYKAGSLFKWNKIANDFNYLGDIPGFVKPAEARKSDRVASYSAGVEIGAELNFIQKAAIDLAIKQRSKLKVISANRVSYGNVYTKITDHLNIDAQNQGSLADEWGLKDAINDPSIYYVIIRDVTYGDSLELLIDGEVKNSASFPVKAAKAKYNVSISGSGIETIKGENTEILFNVYVLRPSWQKRGDGQNIRFDVINGIDIRGLPILLRRVGETS